MSDRFTEILNELRDLHNLKAKDYGSSEDAYANIRATEFWGIPAWKGALLRLHDKVVRLQTLSRKGALHNESAEDSMRDIAVYAVIALVLYEEERRNELARHAAGGGIPVDRVSGVGGPGDVERIPDQPKTIRSLFCGTDEMVRGAGKV